MEIAFVAHASHCALLLDGGGVCRWFVMKDDDEAAAKTARRCVGAQFVASLDPAAEGLLVHEPRVGASLLFAENVGGRISLVRFGPLLALDALDARAAQVEACDEVRDHAIHEGDVAASASAADAAPASRLPPIAGPVPAAESDTTLQRRPSSAPVAYDDERDEDGAFRAWRDEGGAADDDAEDDDHDEVATTIGWRSGFGDRAALPSLEHDPDHEREADTDVATRRFARREDDDPAPPPISKRRGILPRRRTG